MRPEDAAKIVEAERDNQTVPKSGSGYQPLSEEEPGIAEVRTLPSSDKKQ